MMCAIEASKRGRRVLLLDHATKLGSKILISGGGRCNFTNTGISPERYVSQNPHFCRSALSRYTAADFITLVEKHGIAYHEKKLGQLFCDLSARFILEMLVKECTNAGVHFQLNTKVLSLSKTDRKFHIKTNNGDYVSDSLVIATGGLSIPKIGATGFGYEIARQFGLEITPIAPALDGFIFDKKLLQDLEGLAGVSLDVIITCHKTSFRENILFTHQGLSGPAALQASLYWGKGDSITVNLVPDTDIQSWFVEKKESGTRSEIKNLLLEFFPKSFSERFCQIYLTADGPLNQMSRKVIEDFTQHLISWKILPVGTVGFGKAEVTRGGVSTEELSSKTMESKKVPGLYFIGEVVDVTGWLGGYNFQWAWSSGWVAGQYV